MAGTTGFAKGWLDFGRGMVGEGDLAGKHAGLETAEH